MLKQPCSADAKHCTIDRVLQRKKLERICAVHYVFATVSGAPVPLRGDFLEADCRRARKLCMYCGMRFDVIRLFFEAGNADSARSFPGTRRIASRPRFGGDWKGTGDRPSRRHNVACVGDQPAARRIPGRVSREWKLLVTERLLRRPAVGPGWPIANHADTDFDDQQPRRNCRGFRLHSRRTYRWRKRPRRPQRHTLLGLYDYTGGARCPEQWLRVRRL